jgi:GMP synthase-like glutamine amidotransferase
MRLHSLEHVPFENAANIGVWARRRGYSVTRTRFYVDEPLPAVADLDALAVMGGPMGVHQHREHAWLVHEKRFIDQAIGAGVPTIGACLGAQLIADVLGAKVAQNPYVEIGWYAVELRGQAHDCPLVKDLPARFMAFHWHGDTFDIPAGAVHLAGTEACRNQAFAYGGHVIGLQFHLEYSRRSIDRMLRQCGDELVSGPFIQSRDEIVAGMSNVDETQWLLDLLLDSLVASRPDRAAR